jgi:hypothetical protein
MSTPIVDYTQIPKQLINYPIEDLKRGVLVYNYSTHIAETAIDKHGVIRSVDYVMPYFSLYVDERIDMVRSCGAIFGVISGRMNSISDLDWKIVPLTEKEDDLVQALKDSYQIFKEFKDAVTPRDRVILITADRILHRYLPDLLSDNSNFSHALLRWSRRLRTKKERSAGVIEDWLQMPNKYTTFEDFIKKIIFDTHAHGLACIYKTYNGERMQELYNLPGGACFPSYGKKAGDPYAILQVIDDTENIYYDSDEVSAIHYAPYSSDPYGLIPLESLVNKVAEMLLFDNRAAEMADGTRPPDKLVVMGERVPWGELGGDASEIPMNKDEQDRVETIINEARKEGVRVITGHGTPVVADISRADTFQYQSERQRMVREEVGLVFGASNIEMNLTGSDSTSGRESSGSQERKDSQKGILPHIASIENFINSDILPAIGGRGYEFKFEPASSDSEMIKLWTEKVNSGIYSVNEIRMNDIGIDPIDGDSENQFDQPKGASASQGSPMGGESGAENDIMGGLQ